MKSLTKRYYFRPRRVTRTIILYLSHNNLRGDSAAGQVFLLSQSSRLSKSIVSPLTLKSAGNSAKTKTFGNINNGETTAKKARRADIIIEEIFHVSENPEGVTL